MGEEGALIIALLLKRGGQSGQAPRFLARQFKIGVEARLVVGGFPGLSCGGGRQVGLPVGRPFGR